MISIPSSSRSESFPSRASDDHRCIRILQGKVKMPGTMIVRTTLTVCERARKPLPMCALSPRKFADGKLGNVIACSRLFACIEELISHDDSHSMSSDGSHANDIEENQVTVK